MWLGVDVGGERKRFDAALIDSDLGLVVLQDRLDVAAVVALIEEHKPKVVAIDSPRTAAPDGEHLRDCELLLNSSVCGIRWTPDATTLGSSPYYGWILRGLDLFQVVEITPNVEVIEVFPTASWTRWFGRRVGSRARWTRQCLVHLPLSGIPARTNQDQRDAIAAAMTARQFSRQECDSFGEIVVPFPGPPTS